MTDLVADRRVRLPLPQQKYIPVLATAVLLVLLYGWGSFRYAAYGFSDPQVILNIFIDNSYVLVVAVGMTFVILTGGIDLSVGSVVALSTVLSAVLLQNAHWPAYVVLPFILLAGSTLGFGMGCIIHYFEIQPFIVTLAGMFLARGVSYAISTDAVSIRDPFWTTMANEQIFIGDYTIKWSVLISLVVVIIAAFVLAFTRLGRNVYAVGGSPSSALLMGLPVGRTRIAAYTISGFCSGLGGLLFTFYLPSGDSLHGLGMELSVIAAVVIGGTILTGGSGYVLGTVLGVLVLGLIQTIITYENYSSWWTKMTIGVLLFAFILLQRLIGTRKK